MNYYGDFIPIAFQSVGAPDQRPHPPCYIVGTGSPETIELAAELGFGYSAVFVTKKRARSSTTICASARQPMAPRCGPTSCPWA